MTVKYTFNAQGQKVDEEGQIVIEHAYLEGGDGALLRFLRMTEEACPACGRGARPNKLAVRTETAGQETVHCVACDYQVTRRPRPNPAKFRPMNSGQ